MEKKVALKEYKPGRLSTASSGERSTMSPAWPAPTGRAKSGAPNVLFIIHDDTGFGQIGCYGGPINTPNSSLGGEWLLQQHAHHGALLPDALVLHNRP